ncbi:hypothetical protein RJ640_004805 [Escallonia rubra]|uniref:C2 domain-containing protein n=1 Tax=Escallonia rubra TaxID=112253 RepID=A0AA88RCT7_9ASTE|nr:hypothetical protein RJ640_004805 [Escallonia rubra]
MDSPQSVVSPFKNSVYAEPEKQNTDLFARSPDCLSRRTEVPRKESTVYNLEGFLGVLEVYIHQARDIHNICIYHKQDVYAKLCLTSDPENSVSTQIINGGGKNPVFNENLQLNVQTVDACLKCEIWMLSRVRNYLEDQLLGFALVSLSEVVVSNGKLEKDFSLSSTDLFHSPAGFVHLSLSYNGASPEVMAIPALPSSKANDAAVPDAEVVDALSCEFDKIEFPDPKVVNENHMMVSEYFGIPCTDMNLSHSSESLVSSDTENHHSSEVGARGVESFSNGSTNPILSKQDTPPSSISTYESPSASLPASCHSSDTPRASKSPNEECISPPKENSKEKDAEAGDAESNASGGMPDNTFAKPLVTINIEPEQKVVQQDFVDLYMKSMQQFTESLAKMKLPMDMESGPTSSGDSSSDPKSQTPKTTGSRVFYGSRAFF